MEIISTTSRKTSIVPLNSLLFIYFISFIYLVVKSEYNVQSWLFFFMFKNQFILLFLIVFLLRLFDFSLNIIQVGMWLPILMYVGLFLFNSSLLFIRLLFLVCFRVFLNLGFMHIFCFFIIITGGDKNMLFRFGFTFAYHYCT